jgi:aquaporin Z
MLDAPTEPGLLSRLGAEAFGTFGLVLVILATALYTSVTSLGALGGALATGLVLAGLIAALGHISGGHFNPAVSLGAAFTGKLSWLDLPLYWVSQVVGATIAALLVYVTIPSELGTLLGNADTQAFFATTANGWDASSPLSVLSGGQVTFDLRAALILEVVAAAVFVAVTIGVGHRKAAPAVGPFAVGMTLAAVLLVTGPATGGGVNPARSTAAAIFARGDSFGQLWLFWVAPLVGAAIVGLFAMAFAPVAVPVYVESDEDEDDEDDEDEEADEGEGEESDEELGEEEERDEE